MDRSIDANFLNESMLLFPIQYSNFINYIYDLLGETNTPKVYMLALLTLRRLGPMPISHIGENLGIARPNMTAIIDGLTEKGWVTRSTSASDRRITNIEMTEDGAEYLKALLDKLYIIMQEQFSALTDEEISKMTESLEFLVSLGKKMIHSRY